MYEDLLDYIQPTKFIVERDEYNDRHKTPVLTAGKSFIKGYTDEEHGVFDKLPAIIFDDFTTASRYVNFPFKVKSSAMKILVPSSQLVNLKFIDYRMQTNHIRSDTHKRYWISVYAKMQLCIPPLNEQKRIVAKIEELFSELDKGVESLKAAREQLKVYRQSVLKVAFEGRLTENWRKAHAAELESADALLARIKAERAARYRQQLAGWEQAVAEWEQQGGKASGNKKPAKPRKPKELPPLTPDELTDLPSLPEGWGWVKVGELAKKITDGEHFRPSITTSGVYFLSAKDIREEGVSFNDPLYISIESAENALARCNPERGDILIVSRGATVGRMCIVNSDQAFCLLGSVILIKPEKETKNLFLLHGLKYPVINRKIVSISGATAQQAIYLRDIQHVAAPFCSSAEQHQIVQEIEKRFSAVEQMVKAIEEGLQKAEALRQSILRRAFEGKLVPQDKNDEPASELLARIRAERAANAPVKSSRKKEVV